MARPSHPGIIKMKILCAWCCREGQPGYLGELEPLENPQATHGICAQHKIQLLESLPSRSFPDAELLIVVRRNNPALYERLKQSFAAMLAVKVILDGRVSERRAAPWRAPDDRRHHMKTRRIREGTTSPDGNFTILRFTPRGSRPPTPLELDQRTLVRGAFDADIRSQN